jgi:electron transfer flavoprotein alpha subunit
MADSKGVVIVGEVSDEGLAPITAELLGIGRKLADELGQELSALFIGSGVGEAANEAIFFGADKVYVIDKPLFKDYLTDSYVAAVEKFVKQFEPELLLLGHTSLGRDLAPRLAFRLETGITQDCIELALDAGTKLLQKTKPVYGGNALAVYVCEEGRPQMATIRPKAMEPAARDDSRKGEVIPFDPQLDEAAVRGKVTGKVKEEVVGIKLEEANVVVCGGRGIGGAEQFQKLDELASMLNGAVGATRPPCDAKWCPSRYQIGLTGKLVSPSLYIGIALSGASQHIAGMSGSKTVVAINKDPEANIFGIAHYGVVGEYEKVLPAFVKKCQELLSKK